MQDEERGPRVEDPVQGVARNDPRNARDVVRPRERFVDLVEVRPEGSVQPRIDRPEGVVERRLRPHVDSGSRGRQGDQDRQVERERANASRVDGRAAASAPPLRRAPLRLS